MCIYTYICNHFHEFTLAKVDWKSLLNKSRFTTLTYYVICNFQKRKIFISLCTKNHSSVIKKCMFLKILLLKLLYNREYI